MNWEDKYARKKDYTDESEHPSKLQSALLKFDTENIWLLTFIISFATFDDVGRTIVHAKSNSAKSTCGNAL